jgi:hypothetical protein
MVRVFSVHLLKNYNFSKIKTKNIDAVQNKRGKCVNYES